MRILLVEDEIRLAEALAVMLKKNNHGVDLAGDGPSGQEWAETGVYDLIILDRMLPGKEGLDVLKTIRKQGISTPVLLLTAKDSVQNRVEGLNAGADDYLVKPFSMEELLARVNALGRRQTGIQNELLSLESLIFSPLKGEIESGAKKVKLTQKESQLLELFIRNKNQVITKDQILDKVWGWDATVDINNIEVYLSFLRKKLKSLRCTVSIQTVRGIGYCLREEPIRV